MQINSQLADSFSFDQDSKTATSEIKKTASSASARSWISTGLQRGRPSMSLPPKIQYIPEGSKGPKTGRVVVAKKKKELKQQQQVEQLQSIMANLALHYKEVDEFELLEESPKPKQKDAQFLTAASLHTLPSTFMTGVASLSNKQIKSNSLAPGKQAVSLGPDHKQAVSLGPDHKQAVLASSSECWDPLADTVSCEGHMLGWKHDSFESDEATQPLTLPTNQSHCEGSVMLQHQLLHTISGGCASAVKQQSNTHSVECPVVDLGLNLDAPSVVREVSMSRTNTVSQLLGSRTSTVSQLLDNTCDKHAPLVVQKSQTKTPLLEPSVEALQAVSTSSPAATSLSTASSSPSSISHQSQQLLLLPALETEGVSLEVLEDEGNELTSSQAVPSLQRLLSICGQSGRLPSMTEVMTSLGDICSAVKLGEGSYGEAFRLTRTVFKVVPIEGSRPVNGYPQKRAHEMSGEALVALTLSHLTAGSGSAGLENMSPCFVKTSQVTVCHGPYPKQLVMAWHAWDKLHESENEAVDANGEEAECQLYLLIAMEDSGRDLEKHELSKGFEECIGILAQTAFTLAVGECAVQFEHRDMHWGNLLLQPATSSAVDFRLNGEHVSVPCGGVRVSLIDFTASRLVAEDGQLAFCDLSQDPEVFEGPKGEIQFDTYRAMRELTAGDWSASCPATNCLWISYLTDILVNKKLGKSPNLASHKRKLREFRKRSMSYSSCAQMVKEDELFKNMFKNAK
ncbi:hypothetical protein CEUSTIGMA_g11417.t1 [Chlamydomonas eustigma]|uniref:non-specific serine/threonine protein kinase n=1 Tax=Chlamydomonas eustigma TaxID=1157962 RepID=A0A250XM69_9CHLO|nr:hypothetical protein CEUSTIGMA_g11417.t1 [Chlamydomonas eustigma]|eukprot:GAX83992.1 hypothetical protein CEUSTIGMA_g11417.t1 [Chlamydomonas eustigma]